MNVVSTAAQQSPRATDQLQSNAPVTGCPAITFHVFLPLIIRSVSNALAETTLDQSQANRVVVATNFASATAFLYTSNLPRQIGLAASVIDPQRAAVLRGQVCDRNGQRIAGVQITILNHPEYGSTLTQADGTFDIVVNGGGLLTVVYTKAGYLPSQRPVNPPWQDYAWLPDIVMIPLDTQVTTINLSAPVPMQVARGSIISDTDGLRQATLLFPQSLTATLVLSDGTASPLTTLNVRASEYTIGDTGPQAMPASLPPSSGYTYAAEFSVDEALAAHATDVRFSQPLPVYIENFLGFPVGGAVPAGYYDRQAGQWIASTNGRVIKILSITSNLADLDIDGTGIAANASALTALGITTEERTRLGLLYTAGQTLWRVPTTHFTPWDYNWPYGPPPDATPPPSPPIPDKPLDKPNPECGSVIGCEDQTLGELVQVTGTPWQLHYQSNRTPGRKNAYTLKIPLSGATTLPASLNAIRVEVNIAGHLYQQTFAPAPNLSYTITWDGKDGYGRLLQGAQTEQTAYILVHYDYVPQYYAVKSDFANSFARAEAAGLAISGHKGASTVTLSKSWTEEVGVWDARTFGLGGWSLSVQHAYDASSRTLLLGNGQQHRSAALDPIITTVAGNGNFGFSGDNGPALAAQLYHPFDVTVGPDGSLYIADTNNNRIRRVGSDGIITTVVGTGVSGFSGDGGPAIAAELNRPTGVAVGSDSSLYIADTNNNVIRRIGADGIITTVAGTGVWGFSGDGGPATAAQLRSASGVAMGPDGSLYIADTGNHRIRRVGPDGLITTVVGNTPEQLIDFDGVTVGPDGSLYLADYIGTRIHRVGPDGTMTTVAGTGVSGFSGDGGPATAAQLAYPSGVAVGPDGSLYIADTNNSRIRRVGLDGIIATLAGTGLPGFSNDGGPATAAQLQNPYMVAMGPDGSLYIADYWNNRIRRVQLPLPNVYGSAYLLPSDDGRELYMFDFTGHHLKTLDALTGAVRYQFSYSTGSYLTAITDASGNITTIERNGAVPTAIVAPGGQRTTLNINNNGWLVGVTNPASEAYTMSYSADGLLQQFIDPLANVHQFTYDAFGRLIKDENPAGGSTTLSRTEQTNGYTVTTTSALGRSHVYQVEQLPTGALRRSVTDWSGAKTVTLINTDGSEQTTYADGTVVTAQHGPDPRWGMLAQVNKIISLTTPGGLTYNTQVARTAVLTDTSNLFSLITLAQTDTINGRSSTSTYTAATRTRINRSSTGRVVTTTLDALGRVIFEQVADLSPMAYGYDSHGRLVTTTLGTGTEMRIVTFTYNSAYYLASVTDPLSHTINFEYDLAGRVITQTLPDGRTIGYAYDANGNLSGLTPPGQPAHTFNYTPINLLSKYTPPDVNPGSDNTQYTYNADRQLTLSTQPTGQSIAVGYDSSGRLNALTIARGLFGYTYDLTTSNLATISAPGGINLAYTYDGALLKNKTWAGPVVGSVGYTYDNDFRVTTTTVNSGNAIPFQYDGDSLLTQAGVLTLSRSPQNGLLTGSTLNNITDTWIYNGVAEVTNYTATYNVTPLYSVQYTRDKLGRITQKTETIGGATAVYSYTYDLSGRLTTVMTNGITSASYTYDSNGNRLSYTSATGTISGTYDAQDRLLQYGTTTYSYTANGELLTKTNGAQITGYQYDALDNLITVTLPSAAQIVYLIDGQNHRIGKQVNGTLVQRFLYADRLQPVAELDGSNNIISRFVYASHSNVPDYMVSGGVTYRIVADQLGSPRLVINSMNGQVMQRMDYDIFGNVLTDTNPGFQPFGFAGGLYDRDTKLVRFGARDYYAEIGRWTAKDPIDFAGGDTNLYGYVLNDPINFVDSSGKVPISGFKWIEIVRLLLSLAGVSPESRLPRDPRPVPVEPAPKPASPTGPPPPKPPAGPKPLPVLPPPENPCFIILIIGDQKCALFGHCGPEA
jgi:RHS repeat-associated protein